MTTNITVQKTSLHERHEGQKAHFISYGEWLIPDYFMSPVAEYDAMFNTAGLIDMCHEGRIKISGTDALAMLDSLITVSIEKIPTNSCRQCFVLNDRGGVIDDINLFKSEKFCTVYCSALAKKRLIDWLREKSQNFEEVMIADSSTAQGAIEVRGPRARSIVESTMLDGHLSKESNSAVIVQIGQARCLATTRRVFNLESIRIETGSLFIQGVWDRLVTMGQAQGMVPAGWRATELLRVENGMPGVGAEIDENTTPLEIGSAMHVDFTKEEFVGKRALMHSTVAEFTRRLVNLRFEGNTVPMAGDLIEMEDVPIGFVTSAVLSPRNECPMGMGFVDAVRANPNNAFHVRSNDQIQGARIIDPFEMQVSR